MIIEFNGKRPRIDPGAFITENVTIIGDVEIGPGANIWFYTVVRGDTNHIRIGANCNVQDGSVLHVAPGRPLILEDNVALGHRVVVHGCRIGKGCLIGIGAVVLNGAVIGEESIVGAGSVVAPRTVIPPRKLALGTPAKVVRDLKEEDLRMIRGTADEYLELVEAYRKMERPVDYTSAG